jgi:hypothetical protein
MTVILEFQRVFLMQPTNFAHFRNMHLCRKKSVCLNTLISSHQKHGWFSEKVSWVGFKILADRI